MDVDYLSGSREVPRVGILGHCVTSPGSQLVIELKKCDISPSIPEICRNNNNVNLDEILSNVVDGGMAYPFYSSDFFHLPIDELSTP